MEVLFSDHSSRVKQPHGAPSGQERRPPAQAGAGAPSWEQRFWPQPGLQTGCSLQGTLSQNHLCCSIPGHRNCEMVSGCYTAVDNIEEDKPCCAPRWQVGVNSIQQGVWTGHYSLGEVLGFSSMVPPLGIPCWHCQSSQRGCPGRWGHTEATLGTGLGES